MAHFSYIDPVSGMLVVQAIIAGVVGVLAFFRRTIWGFFLALLGRRPSAPAEE